MIRINVLLVQLTVLAFAFTQMASAADLYVATNATGDGSGSSWANATNSIQGAIDAIDGTYSTNTVWVSNGVYEVGGRTNYPSGGLCTTNRVLIWKAITVRSANNDPTNTIIMGNWDTPGMTNGRAAVRCVYMTNGSSLIGFMLTNGATITGSTWSATTEGYGGGVLSQSTNTVISNCVIANNGACYGGAGAFYGTLYDCTLIGNTVQPIQAAGGGGARYSTLYHCTLITNRAADYTGGASYCTLYNCTLIANYAANLGGGAYGSTLSNCTLIGNSTPVTGGGASVSTLINCTLISNRASGNWPGGGVHGSTLSNCTLMGNSANRAGGGANNSILYNCLLTGNSAGAGYSGGGANTSILYNCTVVGNSAPYGGGICGGTSVNSIIYFNTATTDGSNWYNATSFTNSCTAPAPPAGTGNITDNPQFVNTNQANYRLRANSPCVNTGTNGSWTTSYPYDLDGRARIRYGTVDMGAYEKIYEGTIYSFH